jgi:hypothetical protein
VKIYDITIVDVIRRGIGDAKKKRAKLPPTKLKMTD